MKTLRFKTNINCGGCIASAKTQLDKLAPGNWDVQLNTPERILTVKTDAEPSTIITALSQLGFEAQTI